MSRRWSLVLFCNMIGVSAFNALIIWQQINHENDNTCMRQKRKFLICLGNKLCGITEEAQPVAPISATEKGMLLLLEMVLHWIREPDVFCVTERRTENVNQFVLDVASMYVLNSRTLSALTVLSLILLLLLFLFSFVFIFNVFKVCAMICAYLQVFLRFVL